MTKAVFLFSVLLLAWTCSHQGVHTQEEDGMEKAQQVIGTEAPAVDAPADAAPADAAPADAAPADAAPADDAPADAAPADAAPADAAPADDAPADAAPADDAPADAAPADAAPADAAPADAAPADAAPADAAPAVDAPAVDATGFNKTEVCVQAPETGICKAHKQYFFYNSTSMNCEIFFYGGCGGNQNNFKNMTECMEKCHTKEEEPSTTATIQQHEDS